MSLAVTEVEDQIRGGTVRKFRKWETYFNSAFSKHMVLRLKEP